MFSVNANMHSKVKSLSLTVLFSGVIFAPVTRATPAVQDLFDLRTTINSAANTIGDTKSPNRGWGFPFGGGSGMGTADLLNNITSTVLGLKFQIDTNMTAWLQVNIPDTNLPVTPPAPGAPAPGTPTLPLTSSMALPSTVPTSSINFTTDLSAPYIDYISGIPNLSTSLTSLGRAHHREMNSPVRESIDGLQQSMTTLQTTLLQSNLIGSQAVLRTIRASSTLENAQTAWSRFLNLPGRVTGSDKDSDSAGAKSADDKSSARKRQVIGANKQLKRPTLSTGRFYTHTDLWGRDESHPEASQEGESKWYDAIALRLEERRARLARDGAENGRIGRPFVV